jgi:hypothetical protein
MDKSACKLTLIYPSASEARIIDLLTNMDPPLASFTSWHAEGHGESFSKASMSERVRGRIARRVLAAIVPRSQLSSVLEEVRTKSNVPDITYWVEPIEDCGRLERIDTVAVA